VRKVGACKRDAPPKRVREGPTLDERGRYGQSHEREPGQHEQVDAREDPEPRDAERQERDESRGKRRRQIAPAADRAHECDRPGVRRSENERPEADHHQEARRVIELGRSHADQRGPDSEGERRPEARAVQLQRLRD